MNEDVVTTRPNAALWVNVVSFYREFSLGNAFYTSRVKQPFTIAGRIKNRDHVFDESKTEDMQ